MLKIIGKDAEIYLEGKTEEKRMNWRDEEYNGHTNWHTWNASLWLANSKFTYKKCVSLGSFALDAEDAGKMIQRFVEDYEIIGDGFVSEKVDWDSIGEKYFEEDED